MTPRGSMCIYGVDFTSAPCRAKPIVVSVCRLHGSTLRCEEVQRLTTFRAFEEFLQRPGPWLAGMDFPFALPRRFLENVGWADDWETTVRRVAELGKPAFGALLKDYRDARPPGDKQPRRVTDILARACSPMMWHGVPVGRMFCEGAPRLLRAGVSIPPCRPTADARIAVEAYPKLVARAAIGDRPYKGAVSGQRSVEQRKARKDIIAQLPVIAEEIYGVSIRVDEDIRSRLGDDSSGDELDAVLCALPAAWAWCHRETRYGIPAGCDPLEGWIVDPVTSELGVE